MFSKGIILAQEDSSYPKIDVEQLEKKWDKHCVIYFTDISGKIMYRIVRQTNRSTFKSILSPDDAKKVITDLGLVPKKCGMFKNFAAYRRPDDQEW